MQAVQGLEIADMDADLREQLSNLQSLLMLSMVMIESGDEAKTLQLAASSVPSFGCCQMVGVYLSDGGWRIAVPTGSLPEVQVQVEAQLSIVVPSGGAITIPGQKWGWALPLRSIGGHLGYFVLAAAKEPSPAELFLLRVLAQQTGIALANARLHEKERAAAIELGKANTALAETVQALEWATKIHDRFTRVVAAGEGQDGIALALHELTGYPVAVEDRHGNLRAWSGPNRPEPYPKDPPARREQMLRRVQREGRPIRESGRLLAMVNPSADVLGVLAIIDPAGTAGDKEQIALEHGAIVLAMELARLRSLAETELRLGRDLVEELLSGTDDESALARAQALGHDLEGKHRVVVVEGHGRSQDSDKCFQAVRRAASDCRIGPFLVLRGGNVVVISDTEVSWEKFRKTILTYLGGGTCRVGVGSWCRRPSDFPRSYREAQLALKMQHSMRSKDRATCYEDLGVYRILCEVENPAVVELFVRDWLGPLLDYDRRKGAEMVPTLCQYLECGGNYDRTAAALSVHRSTLKYRLQRIREISGYDNLTDPEMNFNLQLATRAWQTLQSLQG